MAEHFERRAELHDVTRDLDRTEGVVRLEERTAVRHVEIEVMRVPFQWATACDFRLDDGRRAAKLFTPWSTRQFRRVLTSLGWPILDLPKVTLRTWRDRTG